MNIMEEGVEKRIKLCTKCLKRIKRDIKDGVKPFLQLAQYQKAIKQELKKSEVKSDEKITVKKTIKQKVKKEKKAK